jgi:LysR family transcriptional regulator, mexEF-oprN operon transcriptional activator
MDCHRDLNAIQMELGRFDLNLLKTLDALDTERSVHLASVRLHVTPSAVSHALGRLRRAFGDPLFARSGQRLVPTERCRAALTEIRPLLAAAAAALDPGTAIGPGAFDPATDRRAVTIVLPGAVELSLLPLLAGRLLAAAPGWSLAAAGFQRRSYEADLLAGDVQVVLSVGGHTPRGRRRSGRRSPGRGA